MRTRWLVVVLTILVSGCPAPKPGEPLAPSDPPAGADAETVDGGGVADEPLTRE